MQPLSRIVAGIPARLHLYAMFGLLALGLSIAQSFSLSAQSARSIEDGMLVIAIDTNLYREDDIAVAEMAGDALLALAETGIIAIGEFHEFPEEARTYSTTDSARAEFSSIAANLKGRDVSEVGTTGLGTMLAKYGTYMTSWNAPSGSKLVVLTAGRFDDPETMTPENVGVFAEHFKQEGYEIEAVSLATTAAPDREVLARLAEETESTYHDMGFPRGGVDFFDSVLDADFEGLQQFGVDDTDPVSLSIDVAPHSTRMVVGLASEDRKRESVLVSPGGQELTASSGNVEVFSSQFVTMYVIKDPEPGRWVLNSEGDATEIFLVSDVSNPITLVVPVTDPFPVSTEVLLTVQARSGDIPHIDTVANVEAEVAVQGSTPETFALNDKGIEGDENGQDGTYSVVLPPQDSTGIRRASFRMMWPGIDAAVEASGFFSVDPFPMVFVTPADSVDVLAGRHLIAHVDLTVGGYPYLATPEEVTADVVDTATGANVATVLEPVEPQDGSAYQYQVLVDVETGGSYATTVSLGTQHLGREHSAVADTVTSSIELAEPPGFNFLPVGIAAAVVLAIVIALGVVVYLRPKPFGYVYKVDINGDHELVADLGSFQFAIFERLWGGNIVPAAALPGIPLRGGSFVFGRERVGFGYRPASDGVLRMTIEGMPLSEGVTPIQSGNELTIASESYLFSREMIDGDVPVSSLLQEVKPQDRVDLSRFTNDPMTFDAPSSVRPTRRN